MENASKALVIAGGILLSLIVMSLVVYMATTLTRIADEQDRRTLSEQIVAFNKEYEAYDKKRMYGTDIITVVNKAIEHNRNVEVLEGDPYYLDIQLNNLNTEWRTKVKKIDISSPENEEEELDNTDITDWNYLISQGVNVDPVGIDANVNLLTFANNGDVILNNNMEKYFSQNATDPQPIYNGDYKYVITSALTNFKRATFECTEVHYNEETGRIDRMTFRQR